MLPMMGKQLIHSLGNTNIKFSFEQNFRWGRCKMIASCALDVKFHDWEDGDCLMALSALDPKSNGFLDINWRHDGTSLVAVPTSGKSLIITPTYDGSKPNVPSVEERWMPVKELIDIPDVTCAAYSKRMFGTLIAGTATGNVLGYNSIKKKVSHKFIDLPFAINMIEFSAQDKFLAAGCDNGQIFIYENQDRVTSAYSVPGSRSLTKMAMHETIPSLLAGGSERGIVAIWDVDSGNNIMRWSEHKGSVMDMAFSLTDDTFTTIGADKRIRIFDLRTADCVHHKRFDTSLTALCYCPNGTDVAVGTGNGQIICLDNRYLRWAKTGIVAHHHPIRKLTFKPSKLPDAGAEKQGRLLEAGFTTTDSGDNSVSNRKVPFISNNCQESVGKGDTDHATLHIVKDESLIEMREDVIRGMKDVFGNIEKSMNEQFLKMRMMAAKEFCELERRNKKSHAAVVDRLLKMAEASERGEDEARGSMSDGHEEEEVSSASSI